MSMVADLRYASALLQWDQETYLPVKGASLRGGQIGTLSEISHELFTDPVFGELMKHLLDHEEDEDRKSNLLLSMEDFDRQRKFSPEFVRKLSEQTQRCFHGWMNAREKNDFSYFEQDLAAMVALKKEEAKVIGYEGHCYDALLNDHDKGSTVAELDTIFGNIRQQLGILLEKISNAPPIEDEFLKQHYPKDLQWQFGLEVLKDMGYDLEAGRQDLSEHPFTVSMGNRDVRVTTRVDEMDLSNMLWSCIHEGGHALYEQGLPGDQYGLPLGEAASYSIHESQSRMWENQMGRSREFCEHYLPRLQQLFPEQLGEVSPDQLFKAINKISPSLIRTEADELTYHLHVIIRYEIEKLLLSGELKTTDLRAYWNESYQKILGVKVPDDKQGCLQDVHWSHGSFGYFPTYSTGSFYAAQFFSKATRDLDGWNEKNWHDKCAVLKYWLKKAVFKHGRKYHSNLLAEKITGESLNSRHFINYLEAKTADLYKTH